MRRAACALYKTMAAVYKLYIIHKPSWAGRLMHDRHDLMADVPVDPPHYGPSLHLGTLPEVLKITPRETNERGSNKSRCCLLALPYLS